jgi:hypothetical protein
MRTPGPPDLSLEHAGAEQASHRQPRSRGTPVGRLPPPGSERRRLLAPTQTRVHGRVLCLLGLEQLGIGPGLRGPRRGQDRPPLVLLRGGAPRHCPHQAVARLRRGQVRLRGTSPPRPPRAAGRCHDASADRLRPLGAWGASPLARLPALRRRAGRCGRRLTRQPPGWHVRAGRRADCGCRRLGRGSGWGVRRRPWVRMHHHQAERCQRSASVAGRHCPRPGHAWPRPTAWRLVLSPSRWLSAARPPRLGLSPGGARRPYGTGARHARDASAAGRQTQTQGAAPRGRTRRAHAAPPVQAPRQTRRTRAGRCDPIPAGASTQADAAGPPPLPTFWG